MTDKQKARVQILANWFQALHKNENPYIIWRDYPYNEPILPTEEQLREFDRAEDQYIAQRLASDYDYETLIAFGESVLGKPTEEVVWDVIARTRPCGCKEAQCSFFCMYYGKEGCQLKT